MKVRNKTSKLRFLDISNLDLDFIPSEVQGCTSDMVSYVDMSHNRLADATFLRFYYNAICINADYNSFEMLETFPKLDNLDTLTLNFNLIDKINEAIRSISKKFPKLKHLSLIQNPCCPFLKMASTDSDLKQYRLRIIGRLPNLLTLDSSPITDRERFEAEDFLIRERGMISVLRNLVDLPTPKPSSTSDQPSSLPLRQSEGNKFISNSDL